MAATAGSSLTISSVSFKQTQVLNSFSSLNTVSVSFNTRNFPSLKVKAPRFHVSFLESYMHATESLWFLQAKPETVDKVCSIVKKQLALADDATVTGDSKFAALGADSLDTYFILASVNKTCLLTRGSYFLNSSFTWLVCSLFVFFFT